MEKIENKVEQIKELIESVSDGFDNLNFETFDSSFPKMVKEMNEVHTLRNQLISEFGLEGLLKFEPDLLRRTKQIEIKYDNLLESFTQEVTRIEKELANYADKRKIANYLRY
jgi:hypothetical protein